MEPAWQKVSSSKSRLSSRKVIQPNGGVREFPCYELTKTETLGMTGGVGLGMRSERGNFPLFLPTDGAK
jgi:hypothetical protein